MAEKTYGVALPPLFGDVAAEKARDEDQGGIGVSDLAKEAYAGLKEGTGQIAAAAGRAGLSDRGEIVGKQIKDSAEDTRATESARARRYRESTFTSDGENPSLSDPDTSFGGAIAMKGAGMVGAMAPVIGASAAATAAGSPIAGLAVGAALGGAQQAGGHVQRIREEIDRASPDLLEQSDVFKTARDKAREAGQSDSDAIRAGREAMFDAADQGGLRSLEQFGIGAVGGAIGAGPRLAAGLARQGGSRVLGGVLGGAEKGVVKRAGLGALEEGASNAAQGAGSESITQDAEKAAGLRTRKDTAAIVNAGIEGGVLGGALGAVGGVVHGRGATRDRNSGVEATADGVGSPEAQALGGSEAAPVDEGQRLLPPPSERRPQAEGTIQQGGSEDLQAYRNAVLKAKTPEARAKAIRALREASARARAAEGESAGRAPNDAEIERDGRTQTAETGTELTGADRLRAFLGADPTEASAVAARAGTEVSVPGRDLTTGSRDLTVPGREVEPSDGLSGSDRLRQFLGQDYEEGQWSDPNPLPKPADRLPAPADRLAGPEGDAEVQPASLTETRALPAPEREPVLADEARSNPEPDPDTAEFTEAAARPEPEAPAPRPRRAKAEAGDPTVTVGEDGRRILRSPEQMAEEAAEARRQQRVDNASQPRSLGANETRVSKLEAEAGDAPFLRRAAKAVAADPDNAHPWHALAHEAAQEKASYGIKGRPSKELQGRFRELNETIRQAREDELEHARAAERRDIEAVGSDEASPDRAKLARQAEAKRHDTTAREIFDATPIETKVLDDIVRAKPQLDSDGIPLPVAPDVQAARNKRQQGAIIQASKMIRETVRKAREAGIPVRDAVRGGDPPHLQWLAHLSGLEKTMKNGLLTPDQAVKFAADERLGRSGRYGDIATQNALDFDGTTNRRFIGNSDVGGEGGSGDAMTLAADRKNARDYEHDQHNETGEDEAPSGKDIEIRQAAIDAERAAKETQATRLAEARRSGIDRDAVAPVRREAKVETVKRRTPAAEAMIARGKSLEAQRREARRSTVDPTAAQAEAGNYRKPRLTLPVQGREALSLRIETPKGGERRGIGADGREWSHRLPHDYGYLEGTRDNTGEPIDVHLGPNLKSDRVFVVDQQHTEGGYDEPKVMMGFDNRREAERAYVAGFGDGKGRSRMGAVREFTRAEFEDWARSDAPSEDRGAAPASDEPRARRSPVTYDTIGSDPVRAAAGYVEALHDRFGLDARVHIVEATDRADVNGFLRRRADGSYEIGINPDRPQAQVAETVAHEYGHLLERELLDHASPDEKAAISQAYADWRARVDPDFRVGDAIEHQTPAHIARYLEEGHSLDGQVSDAYRGYYQSFPEWFAREVALHLTGKPETQGLAARFFNRVAETWRSLVGMLKGHPVAAKEVAEFLDRYARPDRRPTDFAGRIQEATNRVYREEMNARRGREEAVRAPDGTQYSLAVPEDLGGKARDRLDANRIGLRRFGIRALTTDGIRQFNRDLFAKAGRDLLSEVVEVGQRMSGIRQAFADPLLRHAQALAEFERQNPAAAKEGFRLLNRASALELNLLPGKGRSEADIRAANRHHGEGNIESLKSRSEMVRVQRAFEALPDGFRKMALDLSDTLRQQHNDRSRELMANLLDVSDLSDADKATLVRRGMAGALRADDEAKLDNPILWAGLKDLSAKRAGDGLYVPFVRNGEHLVQTREHLGDLRGGRQIGEDGIGFDGGTQAEARAKAEAYIRESHLDPTSVQHQVFDRATGERLVGTDIGEHEGETDHSYIVRVQRKGLHAFDSRTEAAEFIRKAKADGTFAEISHEPLDRAARLRSSEFTAAHVRSLMASIDKIPAERMPAAQREILRGVVADAVARSANSNRFEKHSLARQNVLGMSDDLPRAIIRYADAAASQYTALKSLPQARGLFNEMRGVIDSAGIGDSRRSKRSQVLDAVERQFEAGNVNPNEAPAIIKRALAWSYISHLASPMSSVMNATQPLMNTHPILAGRFGSFRAGTALGAAYRAVGATDAIWSGLKNTGKAVNPRNFARIAIDVNDPVASVRKRLAREKDGAELGRLLDHLGERGAFGNGAEFEYAPSLARGDKGLRKFEFNLDRVFRQLPTSVEAVNRSVSAVAAFRLARESGMTEKAATAYAFDTVMTTQGDYSSFNTPSWMKNPILAPAVQFKRFAQIQYQMLAGIVAQISHGTREERIQGARALANLVAVQIAVAGTLSLPGTELVKLGATLSSVLLGTGGYDDVERRLKRLQEDAFGKEWGTLASRGLITRALGFDVSSRASWSDLLTGMQPDDLSTTQGQYEYVGRLLGGAPVGTGLDLAEGVRKITDGDPLGGFSKLIPVKVVGDTLKGVDRYQRGKATATEAAMNAFGVRSGRQAEVGEEIGAKKAQRDGLTKEKIALDRAIVLARTPRERAIAVSRAKRWNVENKASGVHVNVKAAQGRSAKAEQDRIALQGQ